jgi:hypothetical protein
VRDLLLCETHLLSGGEAEHQCDDHDHDEHTEHEHPDHNRSYDFDFSNWF